MECLEDPDYILDLVILSWVPSSAKAQVVGWVRLLEADFTVAFHLFWRRVQMVLDWFWIADSTRSAMTLLLNTWLGSESHTPDNEQEPWDEHCRCQSDVKLAGHPEAVHFVESTVSRAVALQ